MQASRRSRDAVRFEPATGPCPRCREELPEGAFWERLRAPEGRQAAWRCRHRRADGSWCLIHAGPAIERAVAAEGEGGR